MKYEATHEMWLYGELFKLFDANAVVILDLQGNHFVGGFTKHRLEELGYELREIVVDLTNE